jgi:hypothetical protein
MVEPSGHCPYLGLKQNQAIRFASPTPEHRCYVSGVAHEIPLVPADHQTRFCLSSAYANCPLYTGLEQPSTPTVAGAFAVTVPPTASAPAAVPSGWFASLSRQDRLIYGGMIVLLVIILGAMVYAGVTLLRTPDLPIPPAPTLAVPPPTDTAAPTSAPPSATATPNATQTPQATIAPTMTLTPSATLEPTAAPASPTAAPTDAPLIPLPTATQGVIFPTLPPPPPTATNTPAPLLPIEPTPSVPTPPPDTPEPTPEPTVAPEPTPEPTAAPEPTPEPTVVLEPTRLPEPPPEARTAVPPPALTPTDE